MRPKTSRASARSCTTTPTRRLGTLFTPSALNLAYTPAKPATQFGDGMQKLPEQYRDLKDLVQLLIQGKLARAGPQVLQQAAKLHVHSRPLWKVPLVLP